MRLLPALILLTISAARPAAAQPAADLRSDLSSRMALLSTRGETLLPPDYLNRSLEDYRTEEALRTAAGLPAGWNGLAPAARDARLNAAAERLVRAAEHRFVHDPSASTLDLLPPADRDRYKAFAWDPDDYPGGPAGPHEDKALAMDAALSRVRPERRANSNASAVVTESEYTDAMWQYIRSRRTPVPGQEPRRLDKDALPSFLAMRADAKRDGVDIRILSSDRDPAVAARNAAREANAYAVARFSSHILGLAMDIQMSGDSVQVEEVTTRPMSNIIAMRRSPAHKWMFLHGAAYGWYPYQHEPWHWEYNPVGFRDRFWAAYRGADRR